MTLEDSPAQREVKDRLAGLEPPKACGHCQHPLGKLSFERRATYPAAVYDLEGTAENWQLRVFCDLDCYYEFQPNQTRASTRVRLQRKVLKAVTGSPHQAEEMARLQRYRAVARQMLAGLTGLQ